MIFVDIVFHIVSYRSSAVAHLGILTPPTVLPRAVTSYAMTGSERGQAAAPASLTLGAKSQCLPGALVARQ